MGGTESGDNYPDVAIATRIPVRIAIATVSTYAVPIRISSVGVSETAILVRPLAVGTLAHDRLTLGIALRIDIAVSVRSGIRGRGLSFSLHLPLQRLMLLDGLSLHRLGLGMHLSLGVLLSLSMHLGLRMLLGLGLMLGRGIMRFLAGLLSGVCFGNIGRECYSNQCDCDESTSFRSHGDVPPAD